MAWRTQWAPTQAELSACVECGLCLPVCPTFRLTGDESASPRGRLNAMSAVAAGTIVLDDAVADVLEFCLQCRACEAACPSLVPFGRAMEGARAEATAALSRSRLRRRFAGSWVFRRWLMSASASLAALGQRLGAHRWLPGRAGRGLAGLRRLPFRARSVIGRRFEPDGEAIGTVGLLAGCVMDPWFGPVHRSIVQTLTAAGCRVVVPERQTCCGALAAHEGEAAAAERYLEKNRRAFSGVDLVVADAAGCSAHLREADIGVPVEDAVVSVAGLIEEGVLPRLPESGDRVAVQDPCHHRHAQRIVAQPRAILRAAGLTPVEIDIEGMCCGAAGLYSMAHPETSAELGRRKAEQIKAAEVSVVASANPGCEMQLRAFLGSGIRVAHPVELYAERALGIRG